MMQPIDIAIEYSHSDSSRVRSNAAVALAILGDDTAVARLSDMAREDQDPAVRRAAINRLAHLKGDDRAAQSLFAAMIAERDDDVRIELVRLLAAASEPSQELETEFQRLSREDRSANVRWTALQALSQANHDGTASWATILAAASDDPDADVRARSSELLAQKLASRAALNAAELEASQYRHIGDLKRAGLHLPPIKGSTLRRLRLAWAARRNPNIRVPFVRTRARALMIAALMPFAIVTLVIILAQATISPTQMSGFIFTAMAVAALAAVTVPLMWRPIATAPDRVAWAVCELGWLGLRLFAGAFMGAILILMTVDQFSFARALLIAILSTIVIVGIRCASILAYRKRPQSAGSGGSVQTVVATLAGWSLLLVIVASLALARGSTDVWASLFFALMPAIAAIAIVAARIDASLPDKVTYRVGPAGAVAIVLLCLPAFVGLGLIVRGQRASPFVDELRLGPISQYTTPFEGEFAVRRGVSPRFELEFSQPVTFQVQQRELGDDLTLRILGSDGTSIGNVPSSVDGILGPVYLQKGTYRLGISQGESTAAEPTRLGWAEVPFEQAALRTAGYLARGWGRRSTAEPADGVRLSVKWNGRHAEYEELQAAEGFRSFLINLQKTDSPSTSAVSYAVLHEDEGPFSAGAIVRSVKDTGRNPEAKPMWQLVYGGTQGPLRAELRRQSTVQLRRRPEPDTFMQSNAYRKIFSAREDSLFDGVLGRELRRVGDGAGTVALLEQAGRWLESGDSGVFLGRYFLYAGGPENVPVQTGSILRGIHWQDQDTAGFELIEGTGVGAVRSSLYYLLSKRDTVLLDSPAWPPANDQAQRELRQQYPLQDKAAVTADYISRGDKRAPPLPRAVPISMFQGLLSVRKITDDAGRWIDDFKVDLKSFRPPDVFGHYFMLAKEENGDYVAPGSIVVGESWDNDGIPKMRVIYGWAMGDGKWFLNARHLTYLGPTLPSEAIRIADQLRPSNPPQHIDTRPASARR